MRQILGALLLAFSFGANAALIDLYERDLNNYDDALLTYDSTTGLEWLDLTESGGYSFNSMILELNDSGSAFYGFRHASKAEVLALTVTAGLTILNIPLESMHADVIALQNLVSMNHAESDKTIGFTGTQTPTDYPSCTFSISVGTCHYLFMLDSNNGYGTVIENAGATRDNAIVTLEAHWLVRDANVVPVPAAVWLFGSDLGLLGWMRKLQVGADKHA